ncbi:MAG: MFS transporter [Gammaproteobacteria bacterium]
MIENSTAYTYGKFILAIGVVIFAIGQSLLFIIVAPMAREIGLSETQFGIVFSLANLSLVFAAPFWGRKSDAIGRKPVFIIGLVGSAAGTLLMALTLRMGMAGALTTAGLMAMIFVSRGVYGLTASAIYPTSAAYIADVTDWKSRARGMALIGSANSLGSILGPAIGGGLAFLGVLFPMYAAVAISFVGAAAAMIWLVEPEQHLDRKKNKPSGKPELKFTDRRLRPYMIIWAAFFVTFISLNFITAFFIQDRLGITNMVAVMRTAGLALASMAVIITLVQGVLFQVIHLSPQLLLRLCAPTFAVGLFVMAASTSVVMLMAGFAILGVAFSCATPGINGSASLAVEPHEQGTAAGYLSAANTSGAILGPLIGPFLFKLAPGAPMLVGGIVMTLVGVYALFVPAPDPA